VRVIANRSSGKQGYAIAAEAASRGAAVTLISTVELPTPADVELVAVETAAEMSAAVIAAAGSADVVVMAAAVADFRPAHAVDNKIKKDAGAFDLTLESTTDILAGLGERKTAGQTLVGFAAETDDLVATAEAKMRRKNLDLVVANDVSAAGVGFQHDTNAVCLLRPDTAMVTISLTDKRSVARAVLDAIAEIRLAKS
jgi:phosphopantothenoylcysteine decarboxylase/phosphopantothenate--cysteine ligase